MPNRAAMLRRSLRDLERRALHLPPGPRRYLRKGLAVEAFFDALNGAGARYAVLRWFETLPAVAEGEDIDLLVADEHLAVVERFLAPYKPFPATQKVDLYTESGLPGTDFRGVPYLSKKLAARVLDRAVLLHGRFRVPSAPDHLDSMAFHAVYHKGDASGLPRTAGTAPLLERPDHDYRTALSELATECARTLEVTLEGLDRYLAAEGLRPATDTLERYQSSNPWLRERLLQNRKDIGPLAGLIVFVVREAAVDHAPQIATTIERFGFEVLRTVELSGARKERVTEVVRGGNWGRGPFPRSGGGPASLIFAYDFSHRLRAGEDGQVLNPKSALAKSAVREMIAERVSASNRFNPMHSSDNGWQSIECLEALDDPELVADLTRRIEDISRQVELPWPIVRELSFNGKRAKVAVVDHPVHGIAVAKVFRPGSRPFFERELQARRELGDLPLVPKLLDHGDNWILSPLYEETGKHIRRRLPGTKEAQLTFRAVDQLARFIQALRQRGFFLLDLASHNLLSDRREGLLVTDFEFLQRYPGAVPPLEADLTILGRSSDPEVDQPVLPPGRSWRNRVRITLFHPAISGLPIGDFLARRGRPVLRLRMATVQLLWYLVFGARSALGQASRTAPGRIALKRVRRMLGR